MTYAEEERMDRIAYRPKPRLRYVALILLAIGVAAADDPEDYTLCKFQFVTPVNGRNVLECKP